MDENVACSKGELVENFPWIMVKWVKILTKLDEGTHGGELVKVSDVQW